MRWNFRLEKAYVGDSWLRYDYLLWGAVVGAAIADVGLTLFGLSICFTEANPVARAALDVAGGAGLLALKSVALLVLFGIYRYVTPLYRRAALAAFLLPQLFAVGHNTLLIAQHAPDCM